MDMKCKKLILLTMRMNNANYKKLKFTRTKVVNLEMFFKVNTINIITIIQLRLEKSCQIIFYETSLRLKQF